MKVAHIINAVANLISAGAFVAVVVAVFSFINQVTLYNQTKIREFCAQAYISEYTNEENGTTVRNPIEDKYQECLTESGI